MRPFSYSRPADAGEAITQERRQPNAKFLGAGPIFWI